MRLNKKEIEAIKTVIGKNLAPLVPEIFLYGSRTNDSMTGGDIDLFALHKAWSHEDHKKLSLILARLKMHPDIGDRKINLSLVTAEEIATDPFWKMVALSALQL